MSMIRPTEGHRATTALVLAGGGARGAWQAGCLDVLHRRQLTFDLVVGTSVGGLNGALWAQGDAGRLSELWREVGELETIPLGTTKGVQDLIRALDTVFGGSVILRSFAPVSLAALITQAVFKHSLGHLQVVHPEALADFIRRTVSPETLRSATAPDLVLTLARSGPWRAVAKYLINSPVEPTWISARAASPHQLVQLLLATSAVPVVFPPVSIDGVTFVDGGVADNEPIRYAWERGARRIVVVGTEQSTRLVRQDYDGALVHHLVAPGVEATLESMVDFRPHVLDRLFRQGQADAERSIGQVNTLLQSIQQTPAILETVGRTLSTIDAATTRAETATSDAARMLNAGRESRLRSAARADDGHRRRGLPRDSFEPD